MDKLENESHNKVTKTSRCTSWDSLVFLGSSTRYLTKLFEMGHTSLQFQLKCPNSYLPECEKHLDYAASTSELIL